jgi:hypothetical protein
MGVQICGGWIEGDLDLSECNLPNSLKIIKTKIEKSMLLKNSSSQSIDIYGSYMESFIGDGANINGSFKACSGSLGSYFKNGFRMTRSNVSENLDLSNSLCGIYLSSNSAIKKSINLDGSIIKGALMIESVSGLERKISISLASVKADVFCDNLYKFDYELLIDGFVYSRIGKDAYTSAEKRIDWLKCQYLDHLGNHFRPQPWQHLIRTLRRMGHSAEADEVAIAFQDQRREAGKVTTLVGRCLHWGFGKFAGYGYKPLRLLKIMIGVWFACGFFYENAADRGWIAPGNPVLFQDARYDVCRPENGGNWVTCAVETPPEYSAFQPYFYSLDVILPLVDLQQERDWAPIVGKSKGAEGNYTYGWYVRMVMWFEILFGWVASLLLVAVLTGLTNREGKGEG